MNTLFLMKKKKKEYSFPKRILLNLNNIYSFVLKKKKKILLIHWSIRSFHIREGSVIWSRVYGFQHLLWPILSLYIFWPACLLCDLVPRAVFKDFLYKEIKYLVFFNAQAVFLSLIKLKITSAKRMVWMWIVSPLLDCGHACA